MAQCTSLGSSFQILGASKAKLWPKCLTDLNTDGWNGETVLMIIVTTPALVDRGGVGVGVGRSGGFDPPPP